MTRKPGRSPRKSQTKTDGVSHLGAIAGAVPPVFLLPKAKRQRHCAFLIAVHQRREAIRTYAVMATSAEAALERMNSEVLTEAAVVVVGQLSRDSARRLKLKPGDKLLV
ncbi:hypothetical protein [Methylobacterium sp. C25]|uniref:hypothetical protein n=1 Tax=Methylobacterium sp. C25 TaxID=2721622 RepID=UPI001F3B3A6A|nr:hypothetical protein [Methylobacterium sp. C25]